MRLEDEDPRDEITGTLTIGDRLRAAAARLRGGVVTALTGVHELADSMLPSAPPTLAEELEADRQRHAQALHDETILRQAEEAERARIQQELETRARAAAGGFAIGMQGQREGRPLFENGQYTTCANCGALRRVEHCIWTDTHPEIVGTQYMRDISEGTGLCELVTREPGWCQACAGLVPVQPAPLPRRRNWEEAIEANARAQRQREQDRIRRERDEESRRAQQQRRREREAVEERRQRARERIQATNAAPLKRTKRLITLED